LNDLLLQEAPLLIVALAWMGAIAWAGGRMRASHVPLQQGVLRELDFLQALRQNCAHCSLTRWAKEMPPPAAS